MLTASTSCGSVLVACGMDVTLASAGSSSSSGGAPRPLLPQELAELAATGGSLQLGGGAAAGILWMAYGSGPWQG